MDVAISELRANLKAYVEKAQSGERVVVTERGVPVALLVPAVEESLLDRLQREGVVTRARKAKRPIASEARRVKADGPVADLVSELRRDRDQRVLG
jgi:prevent-host-death family protein